MAHPHGTYNELVLNPTLASPGTPAVAATGAGSGLAAGDYGVVVTAYSAAYGESAPSAASSVTVTVEDELVITSPDPVTYADGWYAYVTQANGSTYTLQQTPGSPTAFGTDLTLDSGALVAQPTSTGPTPPLVATAISGYVNDVPVQEMGTHVGPFT